MAADGLEISVRATEASRTLGQVFKPGAPGRMESTLTEKRKILAGLGSGPVQRPRVWTCYGTGSQ